MSYIVPRNKSDRCTNCLLIDKITYDCKLMYGNDYSDFESQYANCPLVEIPTPHGRLIDADELINSCEKLMCMLDPESKEYLRVFAIKSYLIWAAEYARVEVEGKT